MLKRLGGQRWLEPSVKRQLNNPDEYGAPISLVDVNDAIDGAVETLSKVEPELSEAIAFDAKKVARNIAIDASGRFSLELLQLYASWVDGRKEVPPNKDFTAMALNARDLIGSEKDYDYRVVAAGLGLPLLMSVLPNWVNAGRPELEVAQKSALDIETIRKTLQAEGMSSEDQGHVRALLDAFAAQHGPTISIRQLQSFQQELEASMRELDTKRGGRERAGLAEEPTVPQEAWALAQQSLGASRLGAYLAFAAAHGELGKLAASVKPGASQTLASAGSDT